MIFFCSVFVDNNAFIESCNLIKVEYYIEYYIIYFIEPLIIYPFWSKIF